MFPSVELIDAAFDLAVEQGRKAKRVSTWHNAFYFHPILSPEMLSIRNPQPRR